MNDGLQISHSFANMAKWLTTFALAICALVQVNGFPAQNALGDLPIDCPFHREPLGFNHIGDTIKGTLTQSGNYKFSKIPGNLMQSGKDYLGHAQTLQSGGEHFFRPDDQESNGPQDFEDDESNEPVFSILPFYGNQQPEDNVEYGYDNDWPQDSVFGNGNFPFNGDETDEHYEAESNEPVFSILPFYGNQQPENNLEYAYDNDSPMKSVFGNGNFPFNGDETDEHYEADSNEPVFSILPFHGNQQPEDNVEYGHNFPFFGNEDSEGNYAYVNDGPKESVFGTGYPGYDFSQYLEPAFGNAPPAAFPTSFPTIHPDDILETPEDDNQGNPEQENNPEYIRQKTEEVRMMLNRIYEAAKEEANENDEEARDGIDEAFSQLDSQTAEDHGIVVKSGEQGLTRSMFSLFKPISIPLKMATSTLDQLQALSPLQSFSKAAAKKTEEPVEVKKEFKPASLWGSWPTLNKPQVKNPEVSPTVKSSVDNSRSACLREFSDQLSLKFEQNQQETRHCLANAKNQYDGSSQAAHYNIDQIKTTFEFRNNHDAEILKMCSYSQQKKCNEEEELLEQTPTDFATEINNHLTQLSNAGEILKQTINVCHANGNTRLQDLRDETSSHNC